MVEPRAQRGRDHHNGDDRGDEALEPAPPKALEVDAARAVELDEQQMGDQKARQDEEHRDALHAAGGERGVEVVEDDGGDGECADAVERGDIAAARSRVS